MLRPWAVQLQLLQGAAGQRYSLLGSELLLKVHGTGSRANEAPSTAVQLGTLVSRRTASAGAPRIHCSVPRLETSCWGRHGAAVVQSMRGSKASQRVEGGHECTTAHKPQVSSFLVLGP